jgi:hypothetical protein
MSRIDSPSVFGEKLSLDIPLYRTRPGHTAAGLYQSSLRSSIICDQVLPDIYP